MKFAASPLKIRKANVKLGGKFVLSFPNPDHSIPESVQKMSKLWPCVSHLISNRSSHDRFIQTRTLAEQLKAKSRKGMASFSYIDLSITCSIHVTSQSNLQQLQYILHTWWLIFAFLPCCPCLWTICVTVAPYQHSKVCVWGGLCFQDCDICQWIAWSLFHQSHSRATFHFSCDMTEHNFQKSIWREKYVDGWPLIQKSHLTNHGNGGSPFHCHLALCILHSIRCFLPGL